MKRLLSVTLMVLVTLVGVSAYADALVLCQDSRGVVYVRNKCNSTYDMYPLDPVALGLVGPQGPPGVANGISVAIHGAVENGVKVSGEGFTVSHSADFNIKFDDPKTFEGTPDCTVTALTSDYYFCSIYDLSTAGFSVNCGGPFLQTSPSVALGFKKADAGNFSFICVY